MHKHSLDGSYAAHPHLTPPHTETSLSLLKTRFSVSDALRWLAGWHVPTQIEAAWRCDLGVQSTPDFRDFFRDFPIHASRKTKDSVLPCGRDCTVARYSDYDRHRRVSRAQSSHKAGSWLVWGLGFPHQCPTFDFSPRVWAWPPASSYTFLNPPSSGHPVLLVLSHVKLPILTHTHSVQ